MSTALEVAFYVAVFPGIAFCCVLGLFMVWLDRKVSARVQWRRGPPPAQPFWDVVKLLGKEVVVPAEGWRAGFLALPFFAFGAAGLGAALVWIAALGLEALPVGDLVVVLYLLALPPLAVVLGGSASGNPLGAVGASREMKLALAYELPLALALMVAVFQVRDVGDQAASASTLSLAGLAEFQAEVGCVLCRPSGVLAFLVALLCAQAKLGLVPFDLAEAEGEIGSGALLEYSGGPLALVKLTQALLLAGVSALLVLVFWGGMGPGLAGAGLFALKLLAVLTFFILVRNTNPRVRIDQALRFFWGPATLLALVALVLAAEGV